MTNRAHPTQPTRVVVECPVGPHGQVYEADAEVELDTDGEPYVRWVEAQDLYGRKLPPEAIKHGLFDNFRGLAIELAVDAGLVVPGTEAA